MADRIVKGIPARAARSGVGGAGLVRQAPIDTVACEFTANDTSLRFWGRRESRPSPARNRADAFVFAARTCADGPASPAGNARTCPEGGLLPVVAGPLFR